MACVSCVSLADLREQGARANFTVSDFVFGEVVGRGGFGYVQMVKIRGDSNQFPFALKIQAKSDVLAKGELRHVLAEKAIMEELSHVFICNLFSCFQDELHIYMVMEYINGGELKKRMCEKGCLPEADGKFYAAEITLALEYLHNKSIIYRDLKPENVLIDCEGHVKLIDFGVAGKTTGGKKKGKTGRRNSFVGTSEYLSPELIQIKADEANATGYDSSVDWWALGVMIYEMLVGHAPFEKEDDEDEYKLYQKILRVDILFPKQLSAAAIALIKTLLPAREISSCCGLLKKKAPPAPELTADRVKDLEWFKGDNSINWSAALNRELTPPFLPPVGSPDDTSMFCKCSDLPSTAKAITQQQQTDFTSFGHFDKMPTLLSGAEATKP